MSTHDPNTEERPRLGKGLSLDEMRSALCLGRFFVGLIHYALFIPSTIGTVFVLKIWILSTTIASFVAVGIMMIIYWIFGRLLAQNRALDEEIFEKFVAEEIPRNAHATH